MRACRIAMAAAAALATSLPAAAYQVWQVSPTAIIRPADHPPARGVPRPLELRATACAGEYEPVTFVVTADGELRDVAVSVSDLGGDAGTIPASAVDARAVVVWYQSAHADNVVPQRHLIPEILAKDAGLIVPDRARQDNRLNFEGLPRDAETLQPVTVPAGESRQWWLTIHVPEGAAPGGYRGTVTIAPASGPKTEAPLHLEVPDLALLPPAKHYSIYNTVTLAPDGSNEAGYRVELRNMVAHGVTEPQVTDGGLLNADGSWNFERLHRVLEIRREEGALRGPIILMAHPGRWRADVTEADLQKLRERTAEVQRWAAEQGYPPVLFYGVDEAKGERLRDCRATYRAVREGGGTVTAACYRGYFEDIGELLGQPIISTGQTAGVGWTLEATRALGGRPLCYVPQSATEDPLEFRHVPGFWLWSRGLDGMSPYSYRAAVGEPYIDWDRPATHSFRDHMFTYPTQAGPWPTTHWEGFREAVDDVRYMTTLWATLELARERGLDSPLVRQTRAWMEGIRLDYRPGPGSVHFEASPGLKWETEMEGLVGFGEEEASAPLDYLSALRALVLERTLALRRAHPELATPEAHRRMLELVERARAQGVPRPLDDGEIAATHAHLLALGQQYARIGDWYHAYQVALGLRDWVGTLDPDRYGPLRGEAQLEVAVYERNLLSSPQFEEYYEAAAPPPTGWEAHFDPDGVGEDERWFADPPKDGWEPIAVDKWWEEQGHPDYDGDAWYRVRFRLPDDVRRPVLARFGGTNDLSWVYCNGRYAGGLSAGADRAARPFLLDLTDLIRPGGENTLMVLIRDTGRNGGIIGGVSLVTPRYPLVRRRAG